MGRMGGWVCLVWLVSGAIAQANEGDELFRSTIRPLLKTKCLACHGEDPKGKLKGDLDLRTLEAAQKGGESGKPSLVAGKPEESLLYRAVTRTDPDLVMPPKENDKLTEEQVEAVRKWIALGANWPKETPESKTKPSEADNWDAKDGIPVRTSGGQSPDWTQRKYQVEDLWAYQPVRRPTVPEIRNAKFASANPIDAFIAQALLNKGIQQPAAPAEKAILLRRLTLDLIGLPPTPEEINAFVQDTSADAWRKQVERLLSSSHYAEQQARHWLDVVRYADTNGFSNDFERPNAWRYRDYVIRSFHADKPFDRFLVEQLAGDELDPDNPEMKIAVGFLRSGPWEHTAMTVAAVTRQQWLDDVTHHVGVTFLGQGLRCAACHDHKFDPVPTRDYYRLQAVFATTFFAEQALPFLPIENTRGFEPAHVAVLQRLEQVKQQQTSLQKKSSDALAAFLRSKGVKSIEELPEAERPRKDYVGSQFGLSKTDLSLRKVYQKSQQHLERELLRFQPYAFSVYCGPDNKYMSPKTLNSLPGKKVLASLPTTHILAGGAIESPGETVTPGVLSAVANSWDGERATAFNTIPQTVTTRRLALARWMASPENTLTARVLVNRIWQQHFGTGLVATPNNFGKMGAKPSHPELLDWLTTWFIEHDWSIKKLHRLLVTSRTYQQATTRPDMASIQQVDSRNALLAYFPPRRLAAEELRDALLAITGELNPEAGGPGCFPEMHWEVALQPRHVMGSVAPAYLPDLTPKERNRRTIYAFKIRTLTDPFLEVFNRPGSELSCERRDQTTIAPQAFALFNSQFTYARALALASTLEKKSAHLEGQISLAFRLLYGRDAKPEENKLCQEHVQKMLEHHTKHPPKRSEIPKKVRRQMIEELTGELVEWEEDLTGMDKYQPDLTPSDVQPHTRALAEVCLVLFNSNEFIYVR